MMLGSAIIAAASATAEPGNVDVTTFSAGTGDGTYSFDSTAKTLTVTYGTTTTGIRGSHPVTVGKRYRISWAYSGATGAQMALGTALGGTQYRPGIASDTFVDFTATTATAYITFQRTAAGTTTVSSIEILEIPEVTWVDTAAPTSTGWVSLSTGVTVDSNTGAVTIPATGTSLLARQSMTTVAGTLYRLRWINNSNTTQCLLGTSQGGGQFKTATASDPIGYNAYEFRATSTTTWVQVQRTTTGTAVVSDIRLQQISSGPSTALTWGVNGHPFWAYSGVTESNQMSLVSMTGLRSYRIGMWDTWDAGALADAKRFFDMESTKNVKIVPLLNLHPEIYASNTATYDAGFAYGQTFSSTYPGRLWECGNEYDNECIENGASGALPTDYDDTLYARMSAAIRGMIDGVRAGDPTARVGVGNAGWHHYGFQRRLWAEGVRWDVSIAHWYSDQGSITSVGGGGVNHLAILRDEFGKPIYVTEVNARPLSMASRQAEATWLVNLMAEWNAFASTYDLRVAHIYELLDEPELAANDPPEAIYGLYTETGVIKTMGTDVKAFLTANPSGNNHSVSGSSGFSSGFSTGFS